MLPARNIDRILCVWALFLIVVVTIPPDTQSQDAPAVSVDQLKRMLGHPNVLIVDVRLPKHYYRTRTRIPGAFREEPESAERWAWKYPKHKTIVFY